jgi:hypothetical protein
MEVKKTFEEVNKETADKLAQHKKEPKQKLVGG